MSVLHPVGPLPPRVYWVRRLVVAIAVVLALLLLTWAWGALTGGDNEGGSGTTPGSTQSSSPLVSPSVTASPTQSESPSPSASPSKSATGTQECPASSIEVAATPNKTSYPAGEDPRFTVKVTNTSKKACKRDVGQKAMEVQVNQGKTLIWSSDHCAPGGEAKVVTLDPGKSYTTSVVWSRTLSKEGCPDNQPDAPAGTYALSGRNLTVESDPVAFALS